MGYNGELQNFEKKSLKAINLKFQNSKTVLLWGPLRKFRKSLKDSKVIWRRSSVLKVLAPVGSHVNMVNTKPKVIRKNLKMHFFFVFFFFSKIQNISGGLAQGKPQLKGICTIGSEIIVTRCDDYLQASDRVWSRGCGHLCRMANGALQLNLGLNLPLNILNSLSRACGWWLSASQSDSLCTTPAIFI